MPGVWARTSLMEKTRFKLKYTIIVVLYAVADGISRPWSLRLLRRQVPELLRANIGEAAHLVEAD